MSGRFVGHLALLLFVSVCVGPVIAQMPFQAKFAIEISGESGLPPIYAMISDTVLQNSSPCSTLYYSGTLKRLVDASAGAEQPSALRWKVCVQGDTYLFTPIVIYGSVDRQNESAPLEELRHRTLATHSGKLNDSVKFPEMEEAGLEPLTLRVVTAQSDSPYRPLTRSDVPSVQIDYTPVDRMEGMMTLRNLSNKAIDAYKIGVFQEAGSNEESSEEVCKANGLSEVIAPGATDQERRPIPHPGKMVNGTFIENPKPQYLVLESVLFADGSYEGDEQAAAKMAARVFGAQTQLVRIERLVQPIIAEDGLDDLAKIGRIRAAIQQLSTQADPDIIAQFHAQFANFPEDMLRNAEKNVGLAMKGQSESMDGLFESNEPVFRQHQSRLNLAQWWADSVLHNHR